MKRVLLVILSLSIIALTKCVEKNNPYKALKLPEEKEYSEVVLEILKQDSDLIKSKLLETEYVGLNMAKLEIGLVKKKHDPNKIDIVAFPSYGTSLLELLHYGITDSIDRSSDSLFFSFLNDSTKNIAIDSTLVKSYKFATPEIIQKRWGERRFGYLEFSLPVFNKRKTRAFVQTNFRCTGLCGEGKLYVLEKINGRWTIKLLKVTWVG